MVIIQKYFKSRIYIVSWPTRLSLFSLKESVFYDGNSMVKKTAVDSFLSEKKEQELKSS